MTVSEERIRGIEAVLTVVGGDIVYASEPFAAGSYAITIAQDPFFPTSPNRKRVESVGTMGPRQARTVAQVVVQDQLPCAICASPRDCRILTQVPLLTELFDGLIHANRDARFKILAGAAFDGRGEVRLRSQQLCGSLLDALFGKSAVPLSAEFLQHET